MHSSSSDDLPEAQSANPAPDFPSHFIVERELGRGGMATVYLCTDTRDGHRVAAKVLRSEYASAVTAERFLREVDLTSRLDHPCIPKVIETGMTGGLPFYVMTYVEGESLRQMLDRVGQMPVADAVGIARAGCLQAVSVSSSA